MGVTSSAWLWETMELFTVADVMCRVDRCANFPVPMRYGYVWDMYEVICRSHDSC